MERIGANQFFLGVFGDEGRMRRRSIDFPKHNLRRRRLQLASLAAEGFVDFGFGGKEKLCPSMVLIRPNEI